MARSNEEWARNIISRFDPSFQPRWEVFDTFVGELTDPSKRCLNIGSGVHEDPEFNFKFRLNLDVDILYPAVAAQRQIPFVQSDLYSLPFRDESFDIVLLRFVVEHLENPQRAFQEIGRVLTGEGKVLIITTNLKSPFIWLAKLLPFGLRKFIMKYIYGVADEDVFPTYHRLNSRRRVKKLEPYFRLHRWQYLQDANWNRRWLFVLLFAFHLKTKWLGLHVLRSNFIAILEKSNVS